jgi:hypothetical protein
MVYSSVQNINTAHARLNHSFVSQKSDHDETNLSLVSGLTTGSKFAQNAAELVTPISKEVHDIITKTRRQIAKT